MAQQELVFGLGTGQCGFGQLRDLLARQPQTNATIEEPPLLRWYPEDPASLITTRMAKLRDRRREYRLIADIAAFYLPYAESACRADPRVRFICLQETDDAVVRGFCDLLDAASKLAINHWSEQLEAGWYHDPIWSRCFPKYEVTDRAEAIRLYCEEYRDTAARLQEQFPGQFRIWQRSDLEREDAVAELLEFAGMPERLRVVHTASPAVPPPEPRPRVDRDPYDPSKCVILVPFGLFIHQECDHALKELERRGYVVRRVGGYAAIDQGRNQMATDALLEQYEETLWIDSDIGFHPNDVEKLRRHELPITCGIYPQKGKRALACHVGMEMSKVTFGNDGGLCEILYAGAGFLHIRRQVYIEVLEKLDLPICNERFGAPMIPYFYPMLRPIEEGHWYLAEDYAFCERARQCGFKVMADTSVRLWHVGHYRYGWEDAGMDRPRFGSFTMNFRDQGAVGTETQQSRANSVRNLAAEFPWPSEPVNPPATPDRVWTLPAVRRALSDTINVNDGLIVELGSFIGKNTRLLTDLATESFVVAIDSWDPTPRPGDDEEIAALRQRAYDAFVNECWPQRARIIPMQEDSAAGLRRLMDAGIQPDAVYINQRPSEEFPDLLNQIIEGFPAARIIGHYADLPLVAETLDRCARTRRLRLEKLGTAWRIPR